MSERHIGILRTGLVTSVGLTAPSSCAAFRAKISNPTETRFIDSGGAWIMAHQVELEQPWRGLSKLVKMGALAIEEALQDVPKADWHSLPLLLCVAEAERPARTEGLDDHLIASLQIELGASFSPESAIVPHGRIGVALAIRQARALITAAQMHHVLIVAVDSLLSWNTLSHYDQQERLLTQRNSNGFMPGEGAGALLVGIAQDSVAGLICRGIGFGHEAAHVDSGEPLRAEGLAQAIKASLHEAGCQMHDIDFRITDNSGEQYYFKESALALSRTLRQRREEFDIWHPAECIGEAGSVSGIAAIAAAQAACLKGYASGPDILVHCANDAGQRAALIFQSRGRS